MSAIGSAVSVSWNERYRKPSGRCSRTLPSRRSGIGTRSWARGALWAWAGIVARPANGPAAMPAAEVLSRVRRSIAMRCPLPRM